MSDLALIILDLDGTLVDSRALIIQGITVAAKEVGVAAPTDDAIGGIIGLSLERALATLFPDESEQQRALLLEAYRTEALRNRADPNDPESLFPGTYEFVSDLRESGYLLGIATGKAKRGALHFCDRYGMQGWFDTIQTPDTNPSKPHPGMIESALQETGVSRSRTVMVGDTTYDLEMARNAGVFGVGVSWGNHSVRDLEDAGADHIVRHMSGLTQVIETLVNEGASK